VWTDQVIEFTDEPSNHFVVDEYGRHRVRTIEDAVHRRVDGFLLQPHVWQHVGVQKTEHGIQTVPHGKGISVWAASAMTRMWPHVVRRFEFGYSTRRHAGNVDMASTSTPPARGASPPRRRRHRHVGTSGANSTVVRTTSASASMNPRAVSRDAGRR
jgi:hypothetical protein